MNSFYIDPVIFALGPLQVRWYGLMYVVGFVLAGQIMAILSKRGYFLVPKDKIDLFLTYQLIGMFFGARIFYVFIYNWDYYSRHITELFSVWQGGLSFHGALFGFVIATYIYARKYRLPFLHLIDTIALAGTQGLFFGRIGNFINGELYGRVTDVPWGIIFRSAGPYPRHPSQLYEAICEGIILSLILWSVKSKAKWQGMITSFFLIGYGILRYFVEFFREPDPQLGFFLGGTTSMGQILCFLMVIIGSSLLYFSCRRKIPVNR